MKKSTLIASLILLCVCTFASAKKHLRTYAIGFYNQENLFDTCHDEGKQDYDFLPTGSYQWDSNKYTNKLKNMSRVLAEMGTDKVAEGCAFIGLAEVENSKCLIDLCNQEGLAKRGMKFVHFEGVDKRGIDVAALYNPSLFTLDESRTKLYDFQTEDTTLFTRGFLVVHGSISGEHVAMIVCHLPSRRNPGDKNRVSGAHQVNALKEKILADDKNTKVFIMGDMNDDPTDRSMTEGLRGKETIAEVKADDMYNPWIEVIKGGVGTLSYRGAWNLFDQILLSPTLLDYKGKGKAKSLTFHDKQIFRRDYILNGKGKYEGTPLRTSAGGKWLNGFSDHLPTVVYVVKAE